MIPIRRGEEPDELRNVRYWRRARVLYKFHLDSTYKPEDKELVEYGVVKAHLGLRQHYKCAYCEAQSGEGQVEHFRPKSIYWWLTWSYDNLVLSCGDCNGPAYKGSKFELFDGSKRLLPGETTVDQEQPKLLDPADPTVNPVDCIEFRQIQGRWLPGGRAGDKRGDETVCALGLDRRPALRDYYQAHIQQMRARVQGVHDAIAQKDVALVSQRWCALVGNAFSQTMLFHGLSYDYLAHEFPEDLRKAWGLELQKPGTGLQSDPPMRECENPAHADLPPMLKLQVCALGTRSESTEERDDAIAKLCEAKPRTIHDLMNILDRGRQTVENGLRELLQKNRLVRDGDLYRPAP